MNKLIREYFSFSTTERNGIIVLLIILLVVIISPYFIKLLHNEDFIDYTKIEKEIKSFQIQEKVLKQDHTYNENYKSLNNINPFQFNPNEISKKKLVKLGLNKQVIKNIINYRKKGGVFSIKEDLKKIYGIDEEIYTILKPYIIIEGDTSEIIINPFDPNTLTSEEWKQIGIKDKIVEIIQNYLNAGGRFYKKEDLKKIYGINQKLYKKLEPYIKIDTIAFTLKQKINKDSISLTYDIIELNSADSIALSKIFINKYLVSRIIKYRSWLGGYYLPEQLLEVYGFNDVKAIDQFIVDSTGIKKIDINNAEFKELVNHPYISYDETKAIFTYKKVMGNFHSVDDIRKYKLISNETYKKIRPYLSVD